VPTRLLLEGRDLEELLAQVRDEHGPDAKIVSAEKVRSGGLGGLFGTQKYELTVEIADESGGTASTETASTSAGTIADSASSSAAAAFERALTAHAATRAALQTPVSAAAGGITGAIGSAPSADAAPIASIEELAAQADAADLTTPEIPAASSSAPSFAEMLDGVSDPSSVPDERAPTAAEALNRLLAGAPAEEAAPSVRPFRPNATTPIAKLGVRPLVANTPEGEFSDSSTHIARDNAGEQPSATFDQQQEEPMAVEAQQSAVPVDKPRMADASERLAAAYGNATTIQAEPQIGQPIAGQPTTARMDQPIAGQQNGTRAATEQPVAGRPARQSGLPRKLQSLGVPADIAFRATAPDMYNAVVEAFAALPMAEAPPDGPGETLLVIGESTHAMDVARIVADMLRLDGSDVLFAGRNAAAAGIDPRRRITGPHDARQRAKRLRRSDAPSVVAVEAALDESDWAASIVEGIRPAAVWVVIDASRKTSDVAHHLQGLRRVDAIALRATLSSGDPASALSLRLPVALLDGRPPTPHAWAAMLCERLSLVEG
jgi:hypothetical protein